MNKTSGIVAIFREFLTRYPWQFGLLFLFLVIEGVSAAISVMALVPLADFMLDPSLAKPGLITQLVINALSDIGFSPTF